MSLVGRLLGGLLGRGDTPGPEPDPATPPESPATPAEPTRDGVFRDRARGRDVLFRLYLPQEDAAPKPMPEPLPVVLFSHGLGGGRDAAPYLGHALAQNGYYAFFLQHPGSDSSLVTGARTEEEVRMRLLQATMRPGNAHDRFGDIPAVIDQLAAMNAQGPLAGRLDLSRIGIAGHSYGARNVLAAAGQWLPGVGIAFKEPRIRAGIALSPNIPTGPAAGGTADLTSLYGAIDIPIFHITGTQDSMPLGEGDFDPATRLLPFQSMENSPQYLLVLEGATHNTFSSRLRGGREDIANMRHAQSVATGAVLFFDSWLKGDEEARAVLEGSFATGLAPGDVFTFK
jgi:predicted dienelactone hydrolase